MSFHAWKLSLGLILLLAVITVNRLIARFENGLEVLFLDVGQGDSALIRLPGGGNWLLDAGGGFGEWDMGRKEIFLELARQGMLHVDRAVLTHPDADHGLGFRGVFRNVTVGGFWFHRPAEAELVKPLFSGLRQVARERGIREYPVEGLQTFPFPGGKASLFPVDEGPGKTNDRSLVLRIEYGGCHLLFTGDIERSAERRLLERGIARVDLLKVAHHGSKTSSTEAFLRATNPRWAVISVGIGNRYHHPHPSVLARFHDAETTVFRTDFHGFVEFHFSPTGDVKCRTYQGSCGVSRCPSKG